MTTPKNDCFFSLNNAQREAVRELERKPGNGFVTRDGPYSSPVKRRFNGDFFGNPASNRLSSREIKQLVDWLLARRTELGLSDDDFASVVSAILSSYIEQRVNELVEKHVSASLMAYLGNISLDSRR